MREEEVRDKHIHVIFGGCHAIGLRYRNHNDPHVLMEFFHEDDDNWYSGITSCSSYFTDELKWLAEQVEAWCAAYCDPDVYQYGWKFNKKKLKVMDVLKVLDNGDEENG